MKRFIYYIIFITLFFVDAKSQTNEEVILKGINYIYHIKFDSASFIFNDYIKKNPEDPSGYFFDALQVWWKINLNKSDESNDEIFFEKAGKVIQVCDVLLEKNEKDSKAIFFKGGILGYRGLLKSLRDSWLKAAEDGKEALNLLEYSTELDPNNKDAFFGIGIYNYFAEYVPEKYPLIKPLMLIFPKGDKLKGLMQIKETAEKSKIAKTEAKYILAYLYVNYEKNFIESEKYAKSLTDEFPENPVLQKYLYLSYVGIGKLNEAVEGWKSVLVRADNKELGFDNKLLRRDANYYISICNLRLGRILESEKNLLDCEELNKQVDNEETSFGVFTYLMLGMLFDKKNDHNSAIKFYDKVLSMKNFENSHHEAEQYKKNGYK